MSTGTPGQQAALEAVFAELAGLQRKVTGLETARERDRGLIAGLNAAMRELTGKLGDAPTERQGYCPVPAPRWWQLDGEERAAEVARLRSWVETVFRPGYGHLAARVGPCWQRHDLCLYQLAWLSEIHTVIYQADERPLSAEADWHVRLLPAAVALMAEETGSCDHPHQPSRAVRR
jgi:hypothetical protein